MKLITKKALKRLLPQINEKVSFISKGGCGYFALYLYEELKAKGFNPEIRMLVYEYEDMNHANRIIKKCNEGDHEYFWDVTSLNWTHFMVKLNGYFIDNSGVFYGVSRHTNWSFSSCRATKEFSVEVLKDMLKECDWNSAYDRRKNRTMKKEIKKIVKNLEV